MTPEMKLASVLGRLPNNDTERLDQEMDKLSTAELEEILLADSDGGVFPGMTFQEKVAMADAQGRALAHAEMEKVALNPVGFLGRGFGAAANKVMTTEGTTRALVGAGVGAVGGAMVDPGMNSDGTQGSRWKGALIGAGLGAGAGAGARAAVEGMAMQKGRLGSWTTTAMRNQARGRVGLNAAQMAEKGVVGNVEVKNATDELHRRAVQGRWDARRAARAAPGHQAPQVTKQWSTGTQVPQSALTPRPVVAPPAPAPVSPPVVPTTAGAATVNRV